VEDLPVLRGDGVQGDPQQGGLDDPVLGEGEIQLDRSETGDPVPQRQIGSGRLLGLQPDQSPDRVDHLDRFALHQQLPAQQRPVELPLGEPHVLDDAGLHRQPDGSKSCTEWALGSSLG
jgi:hypothetical protein